MIGASDPEGASRHSTTRLLQADERIGGVVAEMHFSNYRDLSFRHLAIRLLSTLQPARFSRTLGIKAIYIHARCCC